MTNSRNIRVIKKKGLFERDMEVIKFLGNIKFFIKANWVL